MNTKKIAAAFATGALTLLMAAPVFADPVPPPISQGDALGVNYGVYTGLGQKDIRVTVGNIINVALGLLGIVAVVIILIGGFEWMTAGGNEDKTGEAKKRIIAGVIGLAIILSAYAIAKFVINSLVSATT
ncbi:MAG: hypothetical protein HY981_04495 [Candidatus Magasanikbacteria bacterium]|nr:hypothetical protein [Candidatus Magasanikbacteria bacterium]